MTPENGTDDGTTYTLGTYTTLTAAGGVTGTFDAISDDYAFLNFALGYDANNVLLTSALAGDSFCLTGMSANPCGVGEGAFDQAGAVQPFRTCLPVGCIVDIAFDADSVASLRAGSQLDIIAAADGGREIIIAISLAGFSSAHDRMSALPAG